MPLALHVAQGRIWGNVSIWWWTASPPSPVMQRSGKDLVHKADRAPAQGSNASPWDARKQHCGDTGSEGAANHGYESPRHHSKPLVWSAQIRPARRVRGATAMPPKPDLHWPTSSCQTPSASPLAHRRPLDTIGIDFCLCLDSRPGPISPGACTHGVIVEPALLALEHAKDADVHGGACPCYPGAQG
jgi:hypothetical protein